MNIVRRGLFLYLLVFTILIGSAPVLAQLHGDGVLRTGTFNGDVFVSGGKVTVGDQIAGYVLAAAAGTVRAEGKINGEMTAVGGDV